MQPFGSTLKSNAKAADWYPYDFDIIVFVELLQTELGNLSVLNLSSQWSLMKRQLHVYFPKDINGVDTLIYLESKGL